MAIDKKRIAFMGTPDFSVQALQALIDSHHDVVCVYSQPPRPKGRGQKIQKSPVHLCAEAAGIEIRTPLNFKDPKDVQDFADLNLDIAVVAAYGLILPKPILDAPAYGCVNIHASVLPRWRGAAPIHRAIWAGDDETGITLMQMDEGLDTGDMMMTRRVPITADATLPILHDALANLGAEMIVPCLDQIETLPRMPQPEAGMTYAKMLSKDDGRIDWSQSATQIDRQVRALNPWPGTWCIYNDKRLKILRVKILDETISEKSGTILKEGQISCGDGSVLQLIELQPENKKPMDVKTALNGGHVCVGDMLS